jgi:hypothetical protein
LETNMADETSDTQRLPEEPRGLGEHTRGLTAE